MQENEEKNESTIGIPKSDNNKPPAQKQAKYKQINATTFRTKSGLITSPLMRTERISIGWVAKYISLARNFFNTMIRSILIPPLVEPAQAPDIIIINVKANKNELNTPKPGAIKPVEVIVETT